MRIQGLQKLTLLDYPGKVACTVFTGGCNFRCPFCHNALLVTHREDADMISEDEFFSFLDKRKGILDGVCVTGGEPLLNDDIADFIGKIRERGFSVKLDTNGSFPEKLEKLINGGLVDYVAMDIKNSPEKYAATVGRPGFDIAPVKQSVELLGAHKVPYEFRTTAVKEFHSPEDFRMIGKWLCGAERYYIQGFVDSGDLIGGGLHACSREEMEEMLEKVCEYLPEAELRGV